ncbi:MAG TPA: PCRF domain-containing protein, partial [Pseudomonadales bacterium]|nr:PCRF domain-containing protein [Pseudomonadales bacterium]
MKVKLDKLLYRYDELGALLSDSDIIADQKQFRSYSMEYAEIEPVVLCYRDFESKTLQLNEAKLMLKDDDEDIREMAQVEINDLEEALTSLDSELQKLLLPKDPNDSHNVFLEI